MIRTRLFLAGILVACRPALPPSDVVLRNRSGGGGRILRLLIVSTLLLVTIGCASGCTTVAPLAGSADPEMLALSDALRETRRLAAERPLEERIGEIEADLERTLVPIGEGALVPRWITHRGRPGTLHAEHNAAVLSGLAARYAVTADPNTKALAQSLVRGLLALDACSGALDGFIPFEVDPETFAPSERTSHANLYTQILFAYVLVDAWIGPDEEIERHVSLIYRQFVEDRFALRQMDGSAIAKANVGGPFLFLNGRRALDRRLLDHAALQLGDEETRAMAEQRRWRGPLLTPLYLRFFNLEFPTPSSSWLNLQAMTALRLLDQPHDRRAIALAHRYRRDDNPLFRIFGVLNGGTDDLEAVRARLSEFPYPATTSGIINTHRTDVPFAARSYVKLHAPPESRSPLPLYEIRSAPYLWKQRLRVIDAPPESRPNQLLGHDLFQAYWLLRVAEL